MSEENVEIVRAHLEAFRSQDAPVTVRQREGRPTGDVSGPLGGRSRLQLAPSSSSASNCSAFRPPVSRDGCAPVTLQSRQALTYV